MPASTHLQIIIFYTPNLDRVFCSQAYTSDSNQLDECTAIKTAIDDDGLMYTLARYINLEMSMLYPKR